MNSVERLPFVSVIVPTYNRANMLATTIVSLTNQSYGKNDYEIIVVDNNSTDNTRQVIEQMQQQSHVSIEYLFERRQGVHYARNYALTIAKGEILYYTDDDMIADTNLLKEIVKPFKLDHRVAAVTGRVLPKWEKNPPQWILDFCCNFLLSLHDRPEFLIISPYDCGIISCHQALARDAFLKSGGFNPENTGGEWIGDGETGLNIKLAELGYWFGYIGSSLTYHVIPPERMTQGYLNKRLANQGNCDSYTAYRRNACSKLELIKRIVLHVNAMFIEGLKGLLKRLLNKRSWRLNRARLGYYRSRVIYDTRLLFDENWRKMVMRYDWLNESGDRA